MTKHLMIVSIILLFLNPVKIQGEQVSEQLDFNKILLIIHYNHPYYESIDFIKQLYSKTFPNIVFYGEQSHPEVHQISTNIGFYFSKVMADVLTKFPDYQGYIFLQDDVLMNFWNFKGLDLNKIWFAISHVFSEMDGAPSWDPNFNKKLFLNEFKKAKLDGSYHDDWYWWPHEVGLNRAQKAYKNLSFRDKLHLEKNIGRNALVGQVCDMFYLPSKYRNDALRLSRNFENVFCEIAVPMILCTLESPENWEILKMLWGFNGIESYREDVHWIHPLKFSREYYRNFASQIVNNHYNNNVQ